MRFRVFASAALLCVLTLAALPAEALTRSQTRDVQEKLTLLGYSTGPIDGSFGRQTRDAVRAFQKDADLRIDGIVGARTLAALDEFVSKDPSRTRMQSKNIQLDIYEDALTDVLAKGSVTLPSRYAQVTLARSGAGRFTVSINGQIISTSPGRNGLPRISRTFQMPSEDAYILASASGNRNCRLEHTLFVVRQDGTYFPPTPVGNCQGLLTARVQDDELVISFPPQNVPSWRMEESWIYQYGQISQR